MFKDKVVLYFGGESMAGVFGAGIVTGLHDADFYEKIDTLYSTSAGSFNVAYMLSRQPRLGSSIYWEDLPQGFIYRENLISGILRRIQNRVISPVDGDEMPNAVDIDYLMDVSRNVKVLNVDRIKNDPIPTFAKVYDTCEGRVKYIDLREDPLQVLLETASVIPYYFPRREQVNIDGGAVEQIGFNEIRKRHPASPIIVCVNYVPGQFENRKNLVRNCLEGVVASWMYPGNDMFHIFRTKISRFNQDVDRIEKDGNALLVCPPQDSLTRDSTIDPETLKNTWEMGIKESEKILEWAT